MGMATRRNEGMRRAGSWTFASRQWCMPLLRKPKKCRAPLLILYTRPRRDHISVVICFVAPLLVSSSDNRKADDVQRAAAEAKRRQPDEGRSYVHHVRTPIILDDQIMEDPVGMMGKKIDLGYWSIDGEDQAIQRGLDVISNYSLEVNDLILSSIASATMVAGPDLRRAGTLVIDLGAGVTDFVLYRQGYVAYTGVIPVGGDHITGDISMGLRVLEPYTDKLKLEYGQATPFIRAGGRCLDHWKQDHRRPFRPTQSDCGCAFMSGWSNYLKLARSRTAQGGELNGGILLTGGAHNFRIEEVASSIGPAIRRAGFLPAFRKSSPSRKTPPYWVCSTTDWKIRASREKRFRRMSDCSANSVACRYRRLSPGLKIYKR